MSDELDLDADLKVGDVLVSPRGVRWTAEGHTHKGKLLLRSEQGTSSTWWWRYRNQLPKGWRLYRNGEEVL
jgi:hypothetical protein